MAAVVDRGPLSFLVAKLVQSASWWFGFLCERAIGSA